jgi:hypothetical protein
MTNDQLIQSRVPKPVKRWIEEQSKVPGMSTAMWLRQLLVGLHDMHEKGDKKFNLEIALLTAKAPPAPAAANGKSVPPAAKKKRAPKAKS